MTVERVYRHRTDLGSAGITPRELMPDDLSFLMLDHHPRATEALARDVLTRSPGASMWIPETGEFILIAPWRHRQDLEVVHTFGAFRNEDILLQATMQHARERGKSGLVVVDINEVRKPSFYRRHGLHEFEEIVTFEHRQPVVATRVPPRHGLRFERLLDVDSGLGRAVKRLDTLAFPWFWWNSDDEFRIYLEQHGVEIWAGIREDEVVAYAGITMYRRWGHLDRIATDPALQGQGIGAEMLAFAMSRLMQLGARRVALSTQAANTRSRSLYERAGFQHTPRDDYSVYVAQFDSFPDSTGPSEPDHDSGERSMHEFDLRTPFHINDLG